MNCAMVPGEEQCHDQNVPVVQEIPEEVSFRFIYSFFFSLCRQTLLSFLNKKLSLKDHKSFAELRIDSIYQMFTENEIGAEIESSASLYPSAKRNLHHQVRQRGKDQKGNCLPLVQKRRQRNS